MFKFMLDNKSKCHNSIAMPFSRPAVAGIFWPKRWYSFCRIINKKLKRLGLRKLILNAFYILNIYISYTNVV
jgi:hypothetical protein